MNYDLSCPICRDVFDNPFIASCCGNTFCKLCINPPGTCPLCRKNAGFIFNKAVHTMVENTEYICTCGSRIIGKNKKVHEQSCEMTIKKCSRCNFTGNLSERIQHVVSSHPEVIIYNYSELV